MAVCRSIPAICLFPPSSPSVGTLPAVVAGMIYFMLAHSLMLLLDLATIMWHSEHEKDLEILLLRQQLRILQRKYPHPPRLSRCEKLGLAVLAVRFMAASSNARSRLAQVVVVFKPDTLLKWHRELIRRKWTCTRRRPAARPPVAPELEALLLRLAKENPHWGYSKLHGQLCKLGYAIGRSTVRDILKRQRVPSAPQWARDGGSWRTFLGHYNDQLLACDFFTVWLKTRSILFFLGLGTRRVHLAGCTAHPTSAWVTQQARQMSWRIQEELLPIRFLIHDRDIKFPVAFDNVFAADDIKIIQTPFRSPRANAFAERWIRSVREECLDHMFILNEQHLHRVLREYTTYFNHARPHQGIAQQIPAGDKRDGENGPIWCRNVLGGIIHDYYRTAA